MLPSWLGRSLFELEGERYERIGTSVVLHGIDHELLCKFVLVRPMTRAVREFRAALRG